VPSARPCRTASAVACGSSSVLSNTCRPYAPISVNSRCSCRIGPAVADHLIAPGCVAESRLGDDVHDSLVLLVGFCQIRLYPSAPDVMPEVVSVQVNAGWQAVGENPGYGGFSGAGRPGQDNYAATGVRRRCASGRLVHTAASSRRHEWPSSDREHQRVDDKDSEERQDIGPRARGHRGPVRPQRARCRQLAR
jgi:hypothetical protein